MTHSVEEAVLLADRVVVMGGGPACGAPGHVELVAAVDLPHPRDQSSPAFNEIKRRRRDVIQGAGRRPA